MKISYLDRRSKEEVQFRGCWEGPVSLEKENKLWSIMCIKILLIKANNVVDGTFSWKIRVVFLLKFFNKK